MPNESPTTRTPVFARRAILRALALSPVAALVPGLARAAAEKAGLVSANVCMLTPETTEGPFYVDPRLVRADITEGRSGAPLELRMQVVTADCRPIEGARAMSGIATPRGSIRAMPTSSGASTCAARPSCAVRR